MSLIDFTKEEKEVIARKIQKYFSEELDQKIGQFDAEFFLDFIGEEIGSYFYNRGLQDANVILMDRIENITEAIDEIQKPTDYVK